MMSGAIRDAGLLSRCKPHGLRKAAARRLAEAGCSASEIMAITGHKTLAEVERYTRAAGQEQLARRAIKRQSENKSGKLVREEVANDQNDIEIASIIDRMALPTGAFMNADRLRQLPLSEACEAARYWELKENKAPTSTPDTLEKIEAVLRNHGVIVFSTSTAGMRLASNCRSEGNSRPKLNRAAA